MRGHLGFNAPGRLHESVAFRVIVLDFVAPIVANVDDYPLTRSLYLSVDYKPGSQLDPLRKEFLKLVFSR